MIEATARPNAIRSRPKPRLNPQGRGRFFCLEYITSLDVDDDNDGDDDVSINYFSRNEIFTGFNDLRPFENDTGGY